MLLSNNKSGWQPPEELSYCKSKDLLAEEALQSAVDKDLSPEEFVEAINSVVIPL